MHNQLPLSAAGGKTTPKSFNRVLCIDDEPVLRESIVVYLEDSGFEIFEAENGKVGLEVFANEQPDIVLCDLDMPVMGGLEFIAKLSEIAPGTPVIVISGAGVMKDAIEALRLGAWDYLVKPISDMTILEHAVCKALERSRLMQENEDYKKELEIKNQQLYNSFEELRQDQKAGRRVQQRLLPKPSYCFGEYVINYQLSPSLYLSGDFVDFFKVSDHKIVFYLADVSGHGASSSFVTVWLKSLMTQLHAEYQKGLNDNIVKPEGTLHYLSKQILGARLEKYLTIIYAVLDINTNKLEYSIGGHHPSPVYNHNNESRFLDGSGFAIGIHDKAVFETHTLDFQKDSVLAMFSDGILEIISNNSLEEKEQKLLDSIKVETTIDSLLLSLDIFKFQSLPDDVTILMVHRT